VSLLQKSVTFAQALAVFRPTGCKTAAFKRLLLQNFSFATASSDFIFILRQKGEPAEN
jgi:hypothetical protein